MKKNFSLTPVALLVGALAFLPTYSNAALPAQVDGQEMPSLAPMLEQATPAVVSITVAGTHEVKQGQDPFKFFFGKRRGQQSQERPFRGLG